MGLSFAIPSSVAKNVITQIKDKGHVDRGWLGVVIQDVDKNLADSFGLDKPTGALVAELASKGPAAKSGLQVGDVIVEFNGVDILTSGELPHVVGATPPGEKVPVQVIRQGKKKKLTVKVGALPSSDRDNGRAEQSPSTGGGGLLGVIVESIDDETLSDGNVTGGVVVKRVIPDGPAAEAGLQSGDVITQVGFANVSSVKSFKKTVKKLPVGKALPIRFYRDGRPAFRSIMIKQK